MGLFRATSGTTTTLPWDDFKCGIDNNADGDIDDAGTDYVYASYDFNDPQGSTWQKITLSHDDSGNLIDDGLLKYTYDAWNRLVGAWYNACSVDGNGRPSVEGERVATYEYDGLFRRVEKTVANQGSGPVYQSNVNMTGIEAGNRHEHYYYSGWRVIETTDHASGDPYSYADSHVLGQFVYGTQYIDEPVVYDRNTDVSADDDCLEAAGSQRYTYHQDANYRVVMLTAEDGTVVERYRYTAYGEPTVYLGGAIESANVLPVSSVGNPLMHQGLFRDRETLTYQNRFRQLDSRTGRFMQRDPGWGGQGGNDYQYVASAPMFFVDPAGLQECRWFEWWCKERERSYQAEMARLAARQKELSLTANELRPLEHSEWWNEWKYARENETVPIGPTVWAKLIAMLQQINANAAEFDRFRAKFLQLAWSSAYADWNPTAQQHYTRLRLNMIRRKDPWPMFDLLRALRGKWTWTGVEGPMWPLCCFLQHAICVDVEHCEQKCCDHYTSECLKGGADACHGGNRPGSPKPPRGCPKAKCCFTARYD